MSSMWLFGGGIGLLIGAWLLLRGQLVLGLLIGGFALFRLVWIARLRSRRHQRSSGVRPMAARELLRSMAPAQFSVAAGVIGLDPHVVREKFRGGMSLAEMASESGTALDAVISAIRSNMDQQLRERVTAGSQTDDVAAQARSMLASWVPRMVQVHQRDLAR